MIKNYFLLFIIVSFIIISCSESDGEDNNEENSICTGDVLLTSQAEVDDFGESGCIIIDGNFKISNESEIDPISDLSPLSNLKEVTKNFSVSSLGIIEIMDGFPSLEKVGQSFGYGGVYDGMMQNVIEVSGFNSLKSIDGNFTITQTGPLAIISGFNSLKEVKGDFDFWWNDSLTELTGFLELQQVLGDFKIYQNEGEFDINSFNSLESVGGEFFIDLNTDLTSISGFNQLETVERKMEISRNNKLSTIDGFNSVDNLWSIDINNNEALSSISGFESLTTVLYEFELMLNLELITVNAFNNLSSSGNIMIGNTGITDVDFLNSFNSTLDGSLEIYRNNNLIDLSGLQNLNTINGHLLINYNNELSNFCPLQNYIVDVFNGELIILDNLYNPTFEDFQAGNCSL